MTIDVSHLKSLAECDQVFSLYRGDAGTLGFMPKGAFEEGILSGHLLAARGGNGEILGYLLYRVSARMVYVAHLCVARQARGKGIAAGLIEALKSHTTDLDGITLKCRKDYAANDFWPKVGFVLKGRATGRGTDRAELLIWHLDHGHPDLFSTPSTKTQVVIDANVFFDLWQADRPMKEISSALTEPWVEDVVELVLTAEIFNDIARSRSADIIKRSNHEASAFKQVRPASMEVDKAVGALRNLYPNVGTLSERDQSDIRHLASTIAARVKYFVTRDEGVLSKATEILDLFGVNVFSPTELVSHLDWVEREQEYQPQQLEVSRIQVTRADAKQIDNIIESFLLSSAEKPKQLRSTLEACLSNPKKCDLNIAANHNGKLIAMLSSMKIDEVSLDLPLVRATKDAMSPTVIRHMLMRLIVDGASKGIKILRATDNRMSPEVAGALQEMGFLSVEGSWMKPILKGFLSQAEIASALGSIHETFPRMANHDIKDQTESFIWPAKLKEEEIPCYLVSIRAEWAERFFDNDLAAQRFPALSGIRDDLCLGVESVYYGAKSINFTAPGRILWYVSQGTEKNGSMQIKACSRLREVARGGPKQLFTRFHRLGVYSWKDIYERAGKDLNAQMTALRFSHTERFSRPLDRSSLAALKISPPSPGPRIISMASFISLYNEAFSQPS